MTSDPRTMDLHLQANPQLHYSINGEGGQNTRPGEDNTLQFLSQEEQECIQFFEKTIDSLEAGLEDNDRRSLRSKTPTMTSGHISQVDGPPILSPTVASIQASPPTPRDQDIIDLVRPGPDLVLTREPSFSPTNPDFQSMLPTPESHFEIKPKHHPGDSLPSEYNPPLPSGSFGPSDSHSSYHPPGCIPTPVLIAQKIAENQGGSSNITPAALLRRCSLESDKPTIPTADPALKQGPPTSAKPARYPANISLILGNKEHQSQSLPNVSINERRAQMLANLTGTSHPLLQEDQQNTLEQKARNIPTRSISFKDPSPDKSRMEALSKLGLNRSRAMSGGTSQLDVPDSTSLNPLTAADTSSKLPEATSNKLPEAVVTAPHHSQIAVDRKAEILRSDSVGKNDSGNEGFPSPPPVIQSNFYPPPLDMDEPLPPPPTEVTTPEFNSYGGKSILINPSGSFRSDPTISPTSSEPKTLPPVLSNPTEYNNYGGKSKVINLAPVAVPRSDLPDILSSHIDKSQTLPAKPEPSPTELNSYGGKSRIITPSVGINRHSESPARSVKAPAPTPAPKPPRHSYHGAISPQKAAQRALSPPGDHKRRTGSMFRPQSITVQFSGKGGMNEARRDALRKLGLLKDS